MDRVHNPQIEFGQSANYEIRVQGIFHNNWFEMIEGMDMTVIIEENITIIRGNVKDQCHLSGILKRFWRSNLPIISVKRQAS